MTITRRRSILACILLLLSILYGCSSEQGRNYSDDVSVGSEMESLFQIGAEVSLVDDFKCVWSVDSAPESVMEGKAAKELYELVIEKWHQGEKIQPKRNDCKCIYMLFQTDDPFLSSNQAAAESCGDTFLETDMCF